MAQRRGDPEDARKGLEALRRRLAGTPGTRKAQAPPAPAPAAPPSVPEPEPDDPEAFEREMRASGVGPLGAGPRRMASSPGPATAGPGGSGPRLSRGDENALFDDAMAEMKASRARVPTQPVRGAPVLDLHGFSEQDALHEVRRFVELHRGRRAVVVRIITGRGVHGEAVIRPAVHAWLQSAGAVAAWRAGLPAEGGDGVYIVQLRRKAGE